MKIANISVKQRIFGGESISPKKLLHTMNNVTNIIKGYKNYPYYSSVLKNPECAQLKPLEVINKYTQFKITQ